MRCLDPGATCETPCPPVRCLAAMSGDRLVFGRDYPGAGRGTERLVEAGWHPVCGHVRHASINDRLEGTPSPTLVYGLLPRREVAARLVDCDTCRPPEQAELAL